MDPCTDEADETQLRLARAQGDAYAEALRHMVANVAVGGGEREAGDYVVAFAIEEAEGMYEWEGGALTWREPGDANLHLEVSVRDRSDNRFVPGARVSAELVDAEGHTQGGHLLPLLWHPMILHYGRNVRVEPGVEHTLRVHVDPPRFPRHDDVNGRRFSEPVDVEFDGVRLPGDG